MLLNIMFDAPMGKFQLELIYYFIYFSTVVPSSRPSQSGEHVHEIPQHETVGWDDSGKIGKIIN